MLFSPGSADPSDRFYSDLSANQFDGWVSVADLPLSVQAVNLSTNQFSGAVDLSRLPLSLFSLDVSHNSFSGTVSLSHLPNLRLLDLSSNAFYGNVDLSALPASLRTFRLNHNRFANDPTLTHLPTFMEIIDLSDNAFSGQIDLTQLPPATSLFNASFNQFSVIVSSPDIIHPATIVLDHNLWWCSLPSNPLWLAAVMGTCTPATCLAIRTHECAPGTQRVSQPGRILCREFSTCAEDCCRARTDFILTESNSVEQVLANLSTTFTGTIISKVGNFTIMQINSDHLPSEQNQSGTHLLVDDLGDGVQFTVAMLVPVDDAEVINQTAPELNDSSLVFSTLLIHIERRDENGDLIHNVPVSFYLCADDIRMPFTIYRIDGPTNLTDITTIGGSIAQVGKSGGLSSSTCDTWFLITCPTTSTFVGVSAAVMMCDIFACPTSTDLRPDAASTLCPATGCNADVCCVSRTCGDGVVQWGFGEQCEPPNTPCCSKQCRYKPKGTICRKPKGECAVAGTCDGTSSRCGSVGAMPNGRACNRITSNHKLRTGPPPYVCHDGRCIKAGRFTVSLTPYIIPSPLHSSLSPLSGY